MKAVKPPGGTGLLRPPVFRGPRGRHHRAGPQEAPAPVAVAVAVAVVAVVVVVVAVVVVAVPDRRRPRSR